MTTRASKTGTPLQALRFSLGLHNGMGERFLTDWLAGTNVDHWMITTSAVKDTSANVPATISFPKFCELNPDVTA